MILHKRGRSRQLTMFRYYDNMRKRLCQENNAVDMDVHRGRYDYADIGQRIMYARSSDGLYKGCPSTFRF